MKRQRHAQPLLQFGDRLAVFGELHGDMCRRGDAESGGLALELAQVGAVELEQLFDVYALGGIHGTHLQNRVALKE